MNVTSHRHFKNGSLVSQSGDDKMDQIRELLFGEFERLNSARFAELEARVKEIEVTLHQRIDALQSRLDVLSVDLATDQRSAFDDLGREINELGDRIRQVRQAR